MRDHLLATLPAPRASADAAHDQRTVVVGTDDGVYRIRAGLVASVSGARKRSIELKAVRFVGWRKNPRAGRWLWASACVARAW